jgi:hypothetical protein
VAQLPVIERVRRRHNATIQLQAVYQKARGTRAVLLHFKGIKGDGYLKHRA